MWTSWSLRLGPPHRVRQTPEKTSAAVDVFAPQRDDPCFDLCAILEMKQQSYSPAMHISDRTILPTACFSTDTPWNDLLCHLLPVNFAHAARVHHR